MQKTATWCRTIVRISSNKRLFARPNTKTRLMSRLTLFFLIVALLQVHTTARAQTVTISGKDITLKKVFVLIKDQTGFTVFTKADLLKKAKPVTVDVRQMPLRALLDLVLNDQQISYQISNKSIILSRAGEVRTPAPAEQDKQPSSPMFMFQGIVSGEEHALLVGATIKVEGTTRNVLTTPDGSFSVPVAEEEVLQISFVGYTSKQIRITREVVKQMETPLQIALQRATTTLADVTVLSTGYQQLNKERASGSFSKPDMDIFKMRTSSMDVMSRLDGLVAGLSVVAGPNGVQNNTNRIGGGNTTQQAIIRGKSSITLSGNPLYVVNGLPVEDISAINLDDISDITVLKDAVAASIWGARAANGIIVITTKSGKKNAPVKVSYNGFINFAGKPDMDYEKLLTSAQYIQTAKELFNPTQFPYNTLSYAVMAPHEQVLYDQFNGIISKQQADKSLDSLAAIDNKGQIKDIWYRNALTTNHNLSVSAGSAAYSIYGALSYTNTQSNRPGEKDQQFRITINQDVNINKALKIKLNSFLTNQIKSAGNNIAIENKSLPYQLFKDDAGNGIQQNYLRGYSNAVGADYAARSRLDLNFIPFDERRYGHSSSNNLTVNITGEVNCRLFKGLGFTGTYGYQKAPGSAKNYLDHKSFSQRVDALAFTVAPDVNTVPVYYLPVTGGTYFSGNFDQRSWISRNQLVYNATVRDGKDRLNIQIGQEAREQLSLSASTIVRGYDENLQTFAALDYATLSQGVFGTVSSFRSVLNELPFTSLEERTRYNSYFGLLNYFIDEKYGIDASWRTDHSNLIGSDKSSQNKPIWSIGAKWNFSKEKFMQRFSWLNSAAVRATYGITGNSPFVGGTALQDILAIERGQSAPVAGTGVAIISPANRKLNWESTKTTNLGIDLSVLKARLTASIDVYWKNTSDLLGTIPLNPLTGFRTSTGNIGNIRNRGIEITLGSVNVRTKNFEWTSSLTFSYNKNKLVSYSEAFAGFLNNAQSKVGSTYYIGYSMASLFAYRYAGLNNEGDPQVILANGNKSADPAAAQPDDIVYAGTMIPLYNGGLMNAFRYKGFLLNANIVYNLGHVMRRDVNTMYNGRLTGVQGSFTGNVSTYFSDRWKQPGDEMHTDIPRYIAGEFPFFSTRRLEYYTQADRNVVSASYIKLREITLSYSLPQSLLQKCKLDGVRFFVQAGNFMIWKANRFGIDPEYHVLGQGVRNLPPYKHSFSFGSSITF